MLRPVLAAIALLGFVLPPVAATESPANLVATDPDLANELRNTGFGDRLRLVADGLPGGSVELERVPVFTEDAKIVLHTAEGDRVSPPPSTAYFRGWIDDRASGGLVTLSVNQTGDLQGIVNGSAGRALLLGGPAHGISSGLEVRAISPVSPSGGFDCRNGDLRDPRPEAAFDKLVADLRPPAGEPALGGASFTARIAIETDTEYLGKFGGSVAAATDYTAGLFNFTSGLYDSEVDTTHLISHLSLWETPDPWSQTSPNCILYEYGRYWNDNNSGIDRTTSHFLSGKATNAGIAWVGVLCTGAFSFDIDDFGGGCPALVPRTDNYGGAYGVTSGIDGNFDPDNPTVLWDILAVAHEVGHNFNSPHTHCYENLGGNSAAVDTCNAGQCGTTGCHCGATALPSIWASDGN